MFKKQEPGIWEGFLAESLEYMNYSGQSWLGKVLFWRQFPRAWYRYHNIK